MARTQRKKAEPRRHSPTWAWGAALFVLPLVAYLPTLNNGFIWDDDVYIKINDTLRSVDGLRQIWCDPNATPQYYPLVHSTFWLEYHLWGLDPRGYHAVNLLVHAGSAVLLWRLLVGLDVPGAWLAAGIFAVHPVEVESVAWITERKNVLSLFLALLSLWFYFRFSPVGNFDPADAGRKRDYCLSLALFVLALLAKTVVASLPAVVLVVVWWKRRTVRTDVLRVLPFFAVGLALSLVTVWLEKHHVGAQGPDWTLAMPDRCAIAGRAVWFYVMKLAWPVRLTFFYPRWEVASRAPWQFVFPVAALALLVALWWARRRIGRGPLAAALIFGGVLFPALGFIDVYPMRYSFVADHFQYHASIALLALVAAALATKLPRARWAGAALLAALAALTWQQTLIYKDERSIYEDTLRNNPTSWIATYNLAIVSAPDARNREQVTALLARAIDLDPTKLDQFNKVQEATLVNLCLSLTQFGYYQEAIVALRKFPENQAAVNNLALLLANCPDAALRDPQEAVTIALRSVSLARQSGQRLAECLGTLGLAQYRGSQFQPAIESLQESISLGKGDGSERFVLAAAYSRLGDGRRARATLREAEQWLAANPSNDPDVLRLRDELALVVRDGPS